MDNIVVISQNVKLESLKKLTEWIKPGSETLVVSTQLIFENEAALIDGLWECKCEYKNFSDFITDAESETIDKNAFCPEKQDDDVFAYYEDIKEMKNQLIVGKVLKQYPAKTKLIVCDDLGLHLDTWKKVGFEKVECEYYHVENTNPSTSSKKEGGVKYLLLIIKRKTYNKVRNKIRSVFGGQLYSATVDGTKYLFYGSLNRIAYRLDPKFKPASLWEHWVSYLDIKGKHVSPNVVRLSTFHEGYHKLPDRKELNIRLMQDGYLPPNYSSNYLYFYGKECLFWTWDVEGLRTFAYHHLPAEVIKIRKKLYLSEPRFTKKVTKVLCAASGDGDWTAVKNRSDEDKLIYCFGELAKKFPDVEFVYRCHPVWIHPQHQGVNSINRAADYIEYLNLPNLHISSNIPSDGASRLSFKRSSFDEDLKGVNLVFGEHSIAMVDAGFKNIPFCSCNVTGHRAFYQGINELGFPHCSSLDDMEKVLKDLTTDEFAENYKQAVKKYNEMTDKE